MKRITAIALLLLAGPIPAQQPTRQIDSETIAAWAKVGAVHGGYVKGYEDFYFARGTDLAQRGLPGFQFLYHYGHFFPQTYSPDRKLETPLPDLPPVATPFCLSLQRAHLSEADWHKVQALDNLHILDLDLAENTLEETLREAARIPSLRILRLVVGSGPFKGIALLRSLKELHTLTIHHSFDSAKGDDPAELDALAEIPKLRELNLRLSLDCRYDSKKEATVPADNMRHLARLGALKNLRSLDVGALLHVNDDIEVLAGLGQLEELKMELGADDPTQCKRLAKLQNLTHLRLCSEKFQDGDLLPLKAFPRLAELELRSLSDLGELEEDKPRPPPVFTGKGFEYLKPLGKLTSLKIDCFRLTEEGMRHIGELAHLSHLDLSACEIPAESVKHVRNLRKLETLYFRSHRIEPEALLHLGPLPKLRELVIASDKLTDANFKHLRQCGLLHAIETGEYFKDRIYGPTLRDLPPPASDAEITSLELGSEGVTDNALRELAFLPNLKELAANSSHITDEGLRLLAEYRQLERLDLRGTNTTPAGLKHLKPLTHLKYLVLEWREPTTEGLVELAKMPFAVALELDREILTDNLVKLLAEKKLLHLLARADSDGTGDPLKSRRVMPESRRPRNDHPITGLNLHWTAITDKTLTRLADCPNLRRLDLGSTKVTDAGLKELANLKELRELKLWSTKVTEAGVKELRGKLPKCVIEWR